MTAAERPSPRPSRIDGSTRETSRRARPVVPAADILEVEPAFWPGFERSAPRPSARLNAAEVVATALVAAGERISERHRGGQAVAASADALAGTLCGSVSV